MIDDPIKPGAIVTFEMAYKERWFDPPQVVDCPAAVMRVDGRAVTLIYQFRGVDHRQTMDRSRLRIPAPRTD